MKTSSPFRIALLAIFFACPLILQGQTRPKAKQDIDPLALDVLKAAFQPIMKAKSYSFKALIGEEQLGTNNQVITLFHLTEATAQQPDKLRMNVRRNDEVQVFSNRGDIVLFTPEAKLYRKFKGSPTLDAGLADLQSKGVTIPVGGFLVKDPYNYAIQGLTSAYVIGRVTLAGQTVHQLAFTEPDADWQLWVVGGETPRILRVEIVDKKQSFKPRTTIEFLNWDFNANASEDTFVFHKPDDAHQVGVLKEQAENTK